MQAGYTCLRCLSGLRKSAAVVKSSRTVQSLPKRRCFTTVQEQTQNRARGFTEPSNEQAALAALTGKHQIQYGNNELLGRPATSDSASSPTLGGAERQLLRPNNLFHSSSNSPIPEIRRRAAFIKSQAYCPHPSHRQTRTPTNPNDPESRKATSASVLPPVHVKFECPDCGIPISCSEEHWADDYEAHLEICDTLREINEDDHDLRSGRFFPEFDYPGPQIEEALVNMTNWDTYLYSREFQAINEARSMRQATKLLTYPITIGSVLHELSPYNIRKNGRLTTEGLKSLSGRI